MKFQLEVRLGNDGMQTLADVAKAFAEVVNRFDGNCDPLEEGDGRAIRDVNGNTYGHWTVIDDNQ